MRKLFSLFAALTLSVGLWAETVSYRYPEYTDGDKTKGIKEWKTTTVDATVVTSSATAVTWGTAGETTWFVVNENVTISERVECLGEVHLILADNVTLNATQGITVSDESNSLTIYAQSTGTQMGKLIADATSVESAAGIGGGGNVENGFNITINGGIVTATGGMDAAGIGGGMYGVGSNITINGGKVTATGGNSGAGIGGGNSGFGSNITINGGEVTATGGTGDFGAGAGIGGGNMGYGSNITINGGEVTATGGMDAAGIGGGEYVEGSNIFVATSLVVKAGSSADPTTEIAKTRTATTDIANDLAGKQYATIEIDITSIKAAAIAAVNAEIEETDNDNVKAIATNAATVINAATTEAEINALKTLAIANIASAKAAYGEAYTAGETAGDAAGYQRAHDELPTEGTSGPAVTITKGDKTVTFYNTDKVEYSIVDAD